MLLIPILSAQFPIRSTNVPLILGQANFFFEFEACFFRARSEFEIRPKQIGSDM